MIECKWCGADLHHDHTSQLYRYFSATEARFAILTNGIVYEFYSDIDEPNKMDSKPFFTFNMLSFQDHQVFELKKFTKSSFSLEDILTTASTLKYTSAIKRILEKELAEPSEPFVRFFASQIFDGRLTKTVIEQFTSIVKEARKQFIHERINERIKSALSANDTQDQKEKQQSKKEPLAEEDSNGIVTTEEEIEGYYIVKAILRESIDISRVAMRDTKSYCGILLDDNNRKPICRLHFNHAQKYLGVMSQKQEEKIPIELIDDIYKYSDQLKATVMEYD